MSELNYSDLPEQIRSEMFIRHDHNEYGIIVYAEKDVIELMQIASNWPEKLPEIELKPIIKGV
jgi:hypothetical protein